MIFYYGRRPLAYVHSVCSVIVPVRESNVEDIKSCLWQRRKTKSNFKEAKPEACGTKNKVSNLKKTDQPVKNDFCIQFLQESTDNIVDLEI